MKIRGESRKVGIKSGYRSAFAKATAGEAGSFGIAQDKSLDNAQDIIYEGRVLMMLGLCLCALFYLSLMTQSLNNETRVFFSTLS